MEFRGALKVYEGEECSPTPYSIATGRSAAPLISRLAAAADSRFGSAGRVYTIENDFFGHQITVAGLITGQDLIAQLKDKPLGERLLLPDCMLRYHQNVFLDDYTVEQVQEALGVPITFVPSDGFKLLEAILQVEGAGDSEEADGFFPEDDEYFRYNPNVK